MNQSITQQIMAQLETLPQKLQQEVLAYVGTLRSEASTAKSKKVTQCETREAQQPSNPKIKLVDEIPKNIQPNGERIVQLMREGAEMNLFADIKDPNTWLREQRKERPLFAEND